jgi:MFS family permease
LTEKLNEKTQSEASPGVISRTFLALQFRNYRFLWLGEMGHAGGLWLEMIARPLLVLDLVSDARAAALHLGLVIAARTVPSVVLGLVAGVVVDTFDRKKVLLCAKGFAFFGALLFSIIILFDQVVLWHVYVFSIIRGSSMAFDQPARRALIPNILPNHLVTNGLALSTGTVQVMRILGAAGAGLLTAFFGSGITFMVSAALYGFAFLSTAYIHLPKIELEPSRDVGSMARNLVLGLQFAWQNTAIRSVMLLSFVYFLFALSFMQVFAPLFAKQVLGLGDEGFGYMMSVSGIGGICGALVVASLSPDHKRGLILVVSFIAFGTTLVLFSASTYVWVFLVYPIIAILGFGQSSIMPLLTTVLLQSAPENMRGRVMSLMSLDRAMMSVGSIIAGLLAAKAGAQIAQIICGLACVGVASMFLLYKPVRTLD